MHKVITGLLAGLALLPLPALAQEEEEEFEEEFALLEEELAADEVESASKHRQSIFWSPSAVTVFTREDILRSGAITLPDLLRRVPGFDVYELKPSFPLVGARAITDTSNNLVLVLVDGREALIELSGFPLWAALTFDLDEVERIEVIRGPGSTLYGANAFAGVVSVTTISDRPSGGHVYLSGGEEGHGRLVGRLRQQWELGGGTLQLVAGVGTEGRDSPSDPADHVAVVHLRANGYLRYRLGQDLDLSLHGGGILGDGTLYMLVGDFRASDVVNHHVMAKAGVGLGDRVRLKAQLYHIRFAGDFHYRTTFMAYHIWLADVPDFRLDTNTLDAQVQMDFDLSDGLMLMGGGNFRYTTMESDAIIPPEISEIRGAVFLQAQWEPWQVLQLTLGIRLDTNSQTPGLLGELGDLSPRAVAVLRPWPDQAFRIGYGLAFRKPAFVENQMHIEVEDFNPAFPEVVPKLRESVGNEDLVNEEVHSIEVGWRGRFLDGRLRLAVELFYNIYLDLIAFNTTMTYDSLGRPNINSSDFTFDNAPGTTTAFGGEIEAAAGPFGGWTLWANAGLRRVTGEDGARAPGEPVLRTNLGFRYTPDGPGFGPILDIALHYVSSYDMALVDYRNPFGARSIQPLGDVWMAIGRLGYRFGLGDQRQVETGLTLRSPLGAPFRESAGMPLLRTSQSLTASDYQGERIVRLAALYLRAIF